MADEAELKAAYRRLDAVIEEIARAEGAEGVMTEWVVLVASQRYDEDGDGLTQIGTLLPDRGGQAPFHRTMGMLDYALTRMRAEVARDDA